MLNNVDSNLNSLPNCSFLEGAVARKTNVILLEEKGVDERTHDSGTNRNLINFSDCDYC